MQLGDNTIQRVDWQNACPVVLLPRAYKCALGSRVIFLAFLGIFITSLLAGLFPKPDSIPLQTSGNDQVIRETAVNLSTDGVTLTTHVEEHANFGSTSEPIGFVATTTDRVIPSYKELLSLGTPRQWHKNVMTFSKQKARKNTTVLISEGIAHPWVQLSAAGREVFSHRHHSLLPSLCWFAVIIVVWSWFGGMITRIVALRFAQDRRVSLAQLFAFMRKKWLSYVGAIVLPIIGVFLALAPVWLLGGLFGNCFDTTTTFGSIGGFLHLILAFPFALVAVLITAGFLLGWPLMFAAISAEGSDAFDAVSRGFSYVYQRPVQFVFYHICNVVVYVIGIMVAYFVFHETVRLIGYDPTGLMIIFNSFVFAYFWSSSTVIYFLLRRSCDATPFDQVFLGSVSKRTLPPLTTAPNGTPELKTNE
jgi:hypothetical protein